MKEIGKTNCILMGLPHSGKSTFIGALWHIVESGELDDSLKISTLPKDREYLNELRDSWLSCRDIERTKSEHKHQISLNIMSKTPSKEIEFVFPDVAGEMYENQFESRKLDLFFFKLIESTKGIILFINPQDIREPILISEIDQCLGEELLANESNSSKSWNHDDTPTQVVLVDLLQMIIFNTKQKIKIAVVISAWDLVTEKNKEPVKWIESNLPLLSQFLRSNDSKIEFGTWGISAQGGKYSVDKINLLNIAPSQRVIVQTTNGTSCDITLPIKWLLEDE